MNALNRVVVSLILLLLMVLALLLALVPDTLIPPLSVALSIARRDYDSAVRLGVAVGALVVAVLALLLLVAELRRPKRSAVVLTKTPGGTAELAIPSIAMRVRAAAETVPGIREAVPTVRARGNGIDVLIGLSADPDIDLPETSRQVMEVVRSEAETRMGIPVKALRVTFKHVSSGSGGKSKLPLPTDPRSRATGL